MKKLKAATKIAGATNNLMRVSKWEQKKVESRSDLKPLFGLHNIKMPGNGMLPVSEEVVGEDV